MTEQKSLVHRAIHHPEKTKLLLFPCACWHSNATSCAPACTGVGTTALTALGHSAAPAGSSLCPWHWIPFQVTHRVLMGITIYRMAPLTKPTQKLQTLLVHFWSFYHTSDQAQCVSLKVSATMQKELALNVTRSQYHCVDAEKMLQGARHSGSAAVLILMSSTLTSEQHCGQQVMCGTSQSLAPSSCPLSLPNAHKCLIKLNNSARHLQITSQGFLCILS